MAENNDYDYWSTKRLVLYVGILDKRNEQRDLKIVQGIATNAELEMQRRDIEKGYQMREALVSRGINVLDI